MADTLASHFRGSTTDPSVQFVTLQYALYITAFVCVIGGGFYLATAIFIERDRSVAEKQTKGNFGQFSFRCIFFIAEKRTKGKVIRDLLFFFLIFFLLTL